jgi:predicted acetyltransferase
LKQKCKLNIKSNVEHSKFKTFLENLSTDTYHNFNTFGKITSSNLNSIVKNELIRKDKIKFFTLVDNAVISYSFLTKFEKYSKKHNCTLGIVIDDKWQNKNYGKQICKFMIEFAWKKKYKKIWLTVFSDNVRAIAMYTHLGFKIEGIFMNDEIINKKYRHVISMALFYDEKKINVTRKKILDKLL